jgi:hypothetical protein
MLALQSKNHYYFPPISLVVLEKIIQVLFEDDKKKHVGRLLLCIGNFDHFSLRTGLILTHMLGLVLFLYL